MNYLVKIMEAKRLTAIELSKMTDISVSLIRDYMRRDDALEHAYKHTVQTLAKALEVTPRDLVIGGKRMKNKILKTEIEKTAEHLCKCLRDYTDEPMYLNLTLFSRDATIKDEESGEIPDYYSVTLHNADIEEVEDIILTLSESKRVFYDGDKIREVRPFPEERG